MTWGWHDVGKPVDRYAEGGLQYIEDLDRHGATELKAGDAAA